MTTLDSIKCNVFINRESAHWEGEADCRLRSHGAKVNSAPSIDLKMPPLGYSNYLTSDSNPQFRNATIGIIPKISIENLIVIFIAHPYEYT